MLIYVVKPGDTIDSIGNEFKVSLDVIIVENGITNTENLVPGQTIVITNSPLFPAQEKYGEISMNGYAYPYIDREVLQATLPYLTYLSIFTYGFTPEGDLVTIEDDELIEMARAFGVAPIMMISPLSKEGSFSNSLSHSLLNDVRAQEQLMESILYNMKIKGYYGLDIDFEYVLPEDREAFISFVKKTTEILNGEGYLVMAALAPKISAEQPGLLYEAHDYFGIGQAANIVLLMTYEWGYTYGPPMAVAPINKVREVLDYAVTEIPPEKILMGMPNYAYDWTLPFIRGESKARSMGNVEAVEQAAQYGTIIQFDEVAMTPFYNYTDEEGREHIVWFEDARSIDAKLRLIPEYGFRGAGYWNVMRLFPQNWTIVRNLFIIRKVNSSELLPLAQSFQN